ncbi:MAG: deoxyribodipyrimidine photo-lyase [Deltaproteobacteria bacterium]|nr:deoxyribodipyrimidine photo-lyase [Deltaproteobacteria bacterium]
MNLMLFHRDLRIQNNAAVSAAAKTGRKTVFVFIFDNIQIEKNPYFSVPAFKFMLSSLDDLKAEISQKGGRLLMFRGDTQDILRKLIKSIGVTSVFENRDFTPFSREREERIREVCRLNLCEYNCYDSISGVSPELTVKNNGTPYQVFSAFYRNWVRKYSNQIIQEINNFDGYIPPVENEMSDDDISMLKQSLCGTGIDKQEWGGRKNGLNILKKTEDFEKGFYRFRDFPALDSTTKLSSHLKFGTVGVHEAIATFSGIGTDGESLIRQLAWRDFFYSIMYFFPHVLGGAFHKRLDALKWLDNSNLFDAWCNGKTGYPIVDAGMRELNSTGFMHSRVRMITASFLVKDLHQDWRLGEKYFASKLVDYDPALNNGNWQWCASTGCDAQPWFRIFNPQTQQKKFDPDCEYIKKWVPELRDSTPYRIHNFEKLEIGNGYPSPVVSHKDSVSAFKSMYYSVKNGDA